MATDAQGRQLSEDGLYYWDGTAWQPVQQDASAASSDSSAAGTGEAEQTPTADDFKGSMNIINQNYTADAVAE